LLNILLLVPALKTQEIRPAENELTCDFGYMNTIYTCLVADQHLPDSAEGNVSIVGDHRIDYNNESVEQVLYFCRNEIPFIVREFFTEFVNIFQVSIQCSGLMRIRSNDFSKAAKLKHLMIENSPLESIEANAFLGAESLENLDLRFNNIRSIHRDSFSGLVNLRTFMLENNRI
jgi:hypothetical protein